MGELEYVSQGAEAACHDAALKLTLNLMPRATFKQDVAVGPDKGAVTAKQSRLWILFKDADRSFDVIWQQRVVAVNESNQLAARQSNTIVTSNRRTPVLWLNMNCGE